MSITNKSLRTEPLTMAGYSFQLGNVFQALEKTEAFEKDGLVPHEMYQAAELVFEELYKRAPCRWDIPMLQALADIQPMQIHGQTEQVTNDGVILNENVMLQPYALLLRITLYHVLMEFPDTFSDFPGVRSYLIQQAPSLLIHRPDVFSNEEINGVLPGFADIALATQTLCDTPYDKTQAFLAWHAQRSVVHSELPDNIVLSITGF